MLDGYESIQELADIISEGVADRIYEEIISALTSLKTVLPAANVYSHNTWNGAEMRKLLTVARAYGDRVTIFCFPEFAATIVPDPQFIGDADKADIRNIGYIGRYAGADVVVIPQTFLDDTNAVKTFDPAIALIVPSSENVNNKPIKVALEGQPLFRAIEERGDWSTTIESYQKLGVAITTANHICLYENTTLRA